MSLKGFHEAGEPRDWDTVLGTVRGYRWWVLYLKFEQGYGFPAFRKASFFAQPWEKFQERPDFTVATSWRPMLEKAEVAGMHGGPWNRINAAVNGGWHKAGCSRSDYFSLKSYSSSFPHEVPESGCGCGFWAYWNQLSKEWDACFPYIQTEREDSRITVRVPLAGVIEGSGRTIIGEKGFRCEKAKITDLALSLRENCLVERYEPYDLEPGRVQLYTSYRPYIQQPGLFLPYMEKTYLLDEQDMTAICRAAVESRLGDCFTWHKTPEVLLEKCPPDVNYGE